MANYPQLDDCSGVWTLKEVNDAVMGGYWRNASSIGITAGNLETVNEKINIVTTGNATVWGNANVPVYGPAPMSNFNRGLFAGGEDASADTTATEYITFASEGNAADFGDLTVARQLGNASVSQQHGGIAA